MCISGFVKKHESQSIWSNVKGNKTYIYIYIYIKFYETCKCRLDAIVCNVNNIGMKINACVNVRNKLMKAVDKGFIWNPSECKCDKSCDVWEYFD